MCFRQKWVMFCVVQFIIVLCLFLSQRLTQRDASGCVFCCQLMEDLLAASLGCDICWHYIAIPTTR